MTTCHTQTWQGEINSPVYLDWMKCLIMHFSDSNQRSGWGLFPALGKSSVTVEWVCKYTDSILRVLEEAPINTFVLAWRDFKRSAVPALHSGHLINSHIQTRDISTSSLCPLQTDVSEGVVWGATQFTFRFLGQSEHWNWDVCRRGFVGFIQISDNMVKTPHQLSRGFVGAELSNVGVLPKDAEGDATFSLQLINRMHLSSSPRGQVDSVGGGWEAAAHCFLYLCTFVYV